MAQFAIGRGRGTPSDEAWEKTRAFVEEKMMGDHKPPKFKLTVQAGMHRSPCTVPSFQFLK